MTENNINFEGRNILLCVTGGVAAYKAIDLASRLTAAGAVVKTALTENACRLVLPKSFEAVTNSQVFTSLWETEGQYKIGHINLVDWADMVVVAPATANVIGKAANGICDDLVSTILCVCWSKPVIFAPAMNVEMWNNPAVKNNVNALVKMGVEVIGPGRGRLACGAVAEGRMSEPEEIIQAIKVLLVKSKK